MISRFNIRNRPRARTLPSVLCAAVLAFPAVVAADDGRPHMQGEVDASLAYVQTYESMPTDSGAEFTAQIKIRRAGTYAVIAGFTKGECWHRGWFSGAGYYDSAVVHGDAGDVVTVRLAAGKPPMNRDVTVGVFHSVRDICTQG